jgi:hypothetical protein
MQNLTGASRQSPNPSGVNRLFFRKHIMNSSRLIAVLATSLALTAFGTAARADSVDDSSFSGMFTLDRIDGMKDGKKDGMVSKAEFMMMMEKAWAMKTKEMKVKNDMMSAADFKELMGWFSRGEKNK